MNILLLNHYAGHPGLGMEFRPYYMAREWVRMGHRVHIVACAHSHVRQRQPEGVHEPRTEVVDGITYHWFPARAYQGNGVARVLNIVSFLQQVWRQAPRLAREIDPDVVIASSTYPMDIWPAQRIARRAGATLVFEVHDLWPLSPIELGGLSPWHPFILWCAWAERKAYLESDVVVSMLPKVHGHMSARGLDLRKLHVVPNGIALDDWAQEPEPLRDDVAQALADARGDGAVVVGYAGSMGPPNALDTLLDAAAALKGRGLRIVMVGDGHERARLEQRVRAEGLDHVIMRAPIAKTQIPRFLAAIDIAYIGWQRVPIYRFGIAPNKLMDYMMAGRAVLHSVEAGNDPVAEAGCGLTVPPQDPAAVAAGLLQLAALPAAEREAMGRRGRAFVQAHHTYPVLAARFIQACKSEAAHGR